MTSGQSRTRPAATAPGFGVYVHWPFCAAKCPYCDFNSHVRHGGVDEARFLAAYEAEIAQMARLQPGSAVASIFFGGGTPSLMSPRTVAGILGAIARHWTIAADAEITLEANPGSVEATRFVGYRSAGVNRVSLGVQALNDADLKSLGRIHDVAEARRALDIAFATFPRVSFDLIYARPRQTLRQWQHELGEALALGPGHLSLYQLTIEDGTPFAALHASGRLAVPDGDLAHDFYALTGDLCDAAGLPAYEISNHARPGDESRHNLLYWRYGTYAGIGPGAHGRLDVAGRRRALRTERHPETWLAAVERDGHGIVEDEVLDPAAMADEMLLMGLRIAEGLDLDRLRATTGHELPAAALAPFAAAGLLAADAGGCIVRATRDGRMVLNRLVLELSSALRPAVPDPASARPGVGRGGPA
ncbi:MAG: radical SAM family heme chaperone HemW [Hyphomicrobiaceae bacterium]